MGSSALSSFTLPADPAWRRPASCLSARLCTSTAPSACLLVRPVDRSLVSVDQLDLSFSASDIASDRRLGLDPPYCGGGLHGGGMAPIWRVAAPEGDQPTRALLAADLPSGRRPPVVYLSSHDAELVPYLVPLHVVPRGAAACGAVSIPHRLTRTTHRRAVCFLIGLARGVRTPLSHFLFPVPRTASRRAPASAESPAGLSSLGTEDRAVAKTVLRAHLRVIISGARFLDDPLTPLLGCPPDLVHLISPRSWCRSGMVTCFSSIGDGGSFEP